MEIFTAEGFAALLQVMAIDLVLAGDNAIVIGLVLSIALMGFAASFVARLLNKHRWIAYVGLAVILYVALDMILRGWNELQPLVTAYLA